MIYEGLLCKLAGSYTVLRDLGTQEYQFISGIYARNTYMLQIETDIILHQSIKMLVKPICAYQNSNSDFELTVGYVMSDM